MTESTKNLICKECPNGCNLNLEWKDEAAVEIKGNKCPQGIVYAARILKEKKETHIVVKERYPTASRENLHEVASLFGITLKTLHYDIPIEGSPERSVFRVVAEDKNKSLFLLEQVPSGSLETKKKIVLTLEFLAQENLPFIRPYLKNKEGRHILEYKKDFWQIAPFVPGIALDRAKYIYEKWRAPLLADFLIALYNKSKGLSFDRQEKIFSLKDYTYGLQRSIKRHDPSIESQVNGVINFLEKEFMPAYDSLPTCFCHGDYHAMNIIWGQNEIKCVIDWEFCGIKPEVYDMANLIGCLGVEHPSSLLGDLTLSFVEQMKASGVISPTSWKYFLEFIVALRFAWLSEWLRRKDVEMIDLELTYMHALIDNQDHLRKAWHL